MGILSPSAAFKLAVKGDFRTPPGDSEPWAVAVRALHSTFDDSVRLAPADLTGADPEVQAHAASAKVLGAVARFDAPGVESWTHVLRELALEQPTGIVFRQVAERWCDLYAGRQLIGELDQITSEARSLGTSGLVVEATAQTALESLMNGEQEPAVALSRRASRMARTEEVLIHEYLAALVLARARRASGMPYLSLRILRALSEVASGAFQVWAQWESVLSGSEFAELQPARELSQLVDSASQGQERSFAQARQRLLSPSASLPGWAKHDSVSFAMGLSPEPTFVTGDSALLSWRRGESSAMPSALEGWSARLAAQHSSGVVVVCYPNQPGYRTLRASLGLLPGLVEVDTASSSRLALLLSELGLAGPGGLDREALFQSAYGFRFSKAQHDGVFRTGLSRARALVAEVGDLDADERMTLRLRVPVVLADPSSVPTLSERILQRVGSLGNVSASDVAQELKIPKRTVQRTLAGLVEVGACRKTQEGRAVAYEVEDTTYGEPSMTRLKPRLS